ncbi:5'-AMP-activated protein kinase beta subunit, interation domain-containing protein [Mycena pura]|uniref:5'-AMP-activated protein kinase beta subunit, interation domain-containing protein n=1 Tax=Mycena pura TaxID=153505 RepID=A0AAD6VR34_9AGAR|nr:5'-AMP-activated protein kinase beta subunit, interation domain-containing protein [Mycena pura]
MGNASSASAPSPGHISSASSTPRQNKYHRRPTPPTSPSAYPAEPLVVPPPPAPSTTNSSTTTHSAPQAPSSPVTSTPSPGSNGEPVLRANRKSIDLPGLNTFAPTPAQPSSRSRMRVSSSRIVERGRGWLHRESRNGGSSNPNGSFTTNGYGYGKGRAGPPPPRSAAIAIPAGRRGTEDDDEDTGYGRHFEGIARRKAELAEQEQRKRGRSTARSRSRPGIADTNHRDDNSSDRDHLRAPSPSRSPSHSRSDGDSNSRGSLSRSRGRHYSPSRSDDRSREGRRGRGRPYDPPCPSPTEISDLSDRRREQEREEQEREKERYERLYGTGMRPPVSASGAYNQEIVYSTIPLTIGASALIGVAEGDGAVDDDEEDGGRARALAAVVDEIVGSPPPPPLTEVEIAWRGPATDVSLIRAGDDDWSKPTQMFRAIAEAAQLHGTSFPVYSASAGTGVPPPQAASPDAAQPQSAMPCGLISSLGVESVFQGAWCPSGSSAARALNLSDGRAERMRNQRGSRQANGGACWSPNEPFTTTINLPPGTHHFRFIVDGVTVVAPAGEIPNAVDDQGFIANYVAIPGPAGTTTPNSASAPTSATVATATSKMPTSSSMSPSTSMRRRRRPSLPVHLPVHPDGSFWAHSSTAGSREDVRREEAIRSYGSGKRKAVWTDEIPEVLIQAAEQEEAWLEAQAQQQQHHTHRYGAEESRKRHIVLNGFMPEPNIPAAARLPRHLERLILNRPSPGVVIPRVGTGAGNVGLSAVVSAGGAPPSPALRVTTASGTDVHMPMPMMSFTSASNGVAGAHPQFGPQGQSQGQSQDQSQAREAVTSPITSTRQTPLIADDPSVLQTPSHAVLYHLCTSSIRDKMIAVGASTRYRQKYLTTVYYKPAEPVVRDE